MKPLVHYKPEYFNTQVHPITIALIGCGGNGSMMLTQLVRIHLSLHAMNYPGLFVHAFDKDIVTQANMGRQGFYPSEINTNKAITLIQRINRCCQLDWIASPENYGQYQENPYYNITISCVDSVQSRNNIFNHINGFKEYNWKKHDHNTPFYWMDLGNTKDTGQVILNTILKIQQPKHKKKVKPTAYLPSIFDLHPDISKHESKKEQGPSCSVFEALEKQSLFINSTLVQYASQLIFNLIKDEYIDYNGIYLNMKEIQVAKIPIRIAS